MVKKTSKPDTRWPSTRAYHPQMTPMVKKTSKPDTPIIYVQTTCDPMYEGARPYHILTCDGRVPRQRWYDTYAEMLEAVERANPGTIAREEG